MPLARPMAALVVCTSGAAILIIEIAGLKLLLPAFGSSFHVWTAQIGMVMLALALGYWLGGRLIDRRPAVSTVALLMLCGGLTTLLIPSYARPLAEAIANRHYVNQAANDDPDAPAIIEIAPIWRKLDPMLGAFAAFFLPCLILAGISPALVRLLDRGEAGRGEGTGAILAWGTLGSLAGLYLAAYGLDEALGVTQILQGTGAVVMLVGVVLALTPRPSPQQAVERGAGTEG
ncbi:MAG: fused MFS/spermidine synthase [bacterium]